MSSEGLLRERYELREELGSGGQGRVVRAHDHQLGRDVALKFRGLADDRSALLSEARALVTLPPHPGLPLVREDFFLDDAYVLVMDWVDGPSLARLLAERGRPGLPVASVLGWLAQAGQALAHLHGADPPVVHGDVSPANLVLGRNGRIVLVDLGLARRLSAQEMTDPRVRRLGTEGFVAPEVAAGAQPTAASDVYGLAATACALLTGSPPSLAPPRFPDTVPTAEATRLESALRRGLATDPARRPATAGALVELLRAGWESETPSGVLTMLAVASPQADLMWAEDPHAAATAEVELDQGLADVAGAHRGRVVDSGLAAFQRPADAVAATAALGSELLITAGLDTGPAQQLSGRLVGKPAARARQIRDLARRGEVLVSQETRELVPRAPFVDLGRHQVLAGASLYALDAPGLAVPPQPVCPWPGLPPYGLAGTDLFVGREDVAADLRGLLAESGFVAVVGASGVGKSSLLRAGVAAHVPGAVVITPASAALTDVAGLASAPLVVVDQLEEAFTQLTVEQRTRLLDTITGLPVPVAVGIRADQYARCAEHPRLAAAASASHILLGPLGPDGVRRVVAEPATAVGLEFEPGLPELVVADVAEAAGQLPLLSHALRSTWERRDGRILTVAAYRAAGGVRGALTRSAELRYGELGDEGQACAKRLLLRLVQPSELGSDSRRRARLSELRDDPAGRQVADEVLATLVDARLVTVDGDSAEVAHEALLRDWPRLRGWIDEDRAGLVAHRALSASAGYWAAGGRSDDDLLRGARLAAALDLAAVRDDLVGDERDFLEASRQHADRVLHDARRTSTRLRRLLVAAVSALLAATVAGGLALAAAGRAADEATAADAARLAAESRALLERRHDAALLLAVAARRTRDDAQTQSALLRAVQSRPLLRTYLHGLNAGFEDAAYSQDGRQFVTAAFDGVRVWDSDGRAADALPGAHGVRWFSVAVSGDRVYAAGSVAKGVGGALAAWDLATGEQVARVVTDDATRLTTVMAVAGALVTAGFSEGVEEGQDDVAGRVWLQAWSPDSLEPLGSAADVADVNPDDYPSAAMSPDGAVVAVSRPDGSVALFDSRSLTPVGDPWPATPPGLTAALAFSPDGRTLAVGWADEAAQGGMVAFHDPASGEQLRPRIPLGQDLPRALAFDPEGEALAVGGSSGGVLVLSDDPALWIPRFVGHSGRVNTVAWRPDGGMLVSGSYDRTGALWDLTGRQSIGTPLSGRDGAVTAVAQAAGTVVTARSDGTLAFRDGASLSVTQERTSSGPVWALAAEPGGELVAAAGDGEVTVWDAASAQAVTRWSASGTVSALAWSSRDRIAGVVTSGGSARLVVWEPTGSVVGGPWVVGEAASGLAWHPDMRRVAVVGGTARLWDTQTGEAVGPTFARADAALLAAAFTADGSLITGAYSGALDRWDIADGERRSVAGTGSDPVVGLAASADGRRAAAVTILGDTQLADLDAMRVVGDTFVGGYAGPSAFEGLPNGGELPFNAQFLDGSRVATAGVDMAAGSAKAWDLDPAAWERAACALAGRDLTPAERDQYQVQADACS